MLSGDHKSADCTHSEKFRRAISFKYEKSKVIVKGDQRMIVSADLPPSEDWVDPPLPGGFMLAQAAPVYTDEQLMAWANYISPPRGWPQAFTWYQLCGRR